MYFVDLPNGQNIQRINAHWIQEPSQKPSAVYPEQQQRKSCLSHAVSNISDISNYRVASLLKRNLSAHKN